MILKITFEIKLLLLGLLKTAQEKNWCIANKSYSDGFKFCIITALQLMGECVEKWSVLYTEIFPVQDFSHDLI